MMWGSVGKYLDGWAKFAVAIVAVGWFGLHAADRYVPQTATVMIGPTASIAPRESPPILPAVAREAVIEPSSRVVSASVFGDLIREFTVAISTLAANTIAQLIAVMAIGVSGGLALRPKVNQWRETRAVRAARRRADRHAKDLRLLAVHDAKGNVPGPAVAAIQPMKRH